MKSAALRPLLPCLLLAGCGSFFQSNAKPEQTYILRPTTAAGTAGAAAAAGSGTAAGDNPATAAAVPELSVRVGRPITAPGLETPHIMLVQSNHRMNFYTGSRWAAATADLIESLTVESLRASGNWSSVQDSSSPFPSAYLLTLTVQRFEADYTDGAAAPVVHVLLQCTVGRREGREVIATFIARGEAPAAENRLGAVVAAFETATGSALSSLSQQAARAAQADRAPREIAPSPTEQH